MGKNLLRNISLYNVLRYFTSIEEIRSTIEFPPKSAFFSQLKQQNVSDEDYELSKQLYDARRQLR